MKLQRILGWVAGATLGGLTTQAQITTQYDFTGLNLAIPDASLSGLGNEQSVTSAEQVIQSLTVTVDIQGTGDGAFNGDYYAYLTHGSGFAVLLNRAGKTSGDATGYGDNGYNSLTFDDGAANGDIHLYQNTLAPSGNGALTGIWAPDGRSVNPTTVLDTDGRSATLGSFAGVDPNGTWTLFIADLSGGGTAQLASWSLSITATPVPEPSDYGLAAGAILLGLALWRKKQATKPAPG
jgi:subtilisin-like proprotein convertase family protein